MLTARLARRILLAALILVVSFASPGIAQLRGIKAQVTPIVETDKVPAGGALRVALEVTLPEGFHVQSNKPRDESLIATVLTVEPPAGVTVGEVVFPPSTDLKQEGLDQPLAVFGTHFTVGVRLDIARDAPAGNLAIPAKLRYQSCDEKMCYAPATVDAMWTSSVVAAGSPLVKSNADVFDKIAFGTGTAGAAAGAGGAKAASGPVKVDVSALDGFTVSATTGGYLSSADFLKFIHNAEAGITEKGMFEGRGPIAIILLVLLGGLALNLTPCVLPMIPINLAIIGAGAQAGSRARGFFLGATYGLAMAVVYGVLGVVVILTAGTFGTLNASPWFNVGIAALFIVLALAMFDVINIDFSTYSNSFNPKAGRGTFVLAFSMGAVAALLAGACVAPVVIQVILFSSNLYATGTKVALALPFCLGLGMALPWPVAGAGLAALPKPGMWMVRVKQAFGVLILGMSVYYGYLAYELFSSRWVDSSAVASSVEEKLKAGWQASLNEGLAQAKRENKPVLIDMWATWCKNCLTMDKTTFEDEGVKAALSGYVKIKFQAETPDEPPASLVMKRFEAVGLPTYVILKPKP